MLQTFANQESWMNLLSKIHKNTSIARNQPVVFFFLKGVGGGKDPEQKLLLQGIHTDSQRKSMATAKNHLAPEILREVQIRTTRKPLPHHCRIATL